MRKEVVNGFPFMVQQSIDVQATIAIALLALLSVSILPVRRDHPKPFAHVVVLLSLMLCAASLLFILIYRRAITDSLCTVQPESVLSTKWKLAHHSHESPY